MSDESKNSLQNMIDLAKQAEEAYEQLNDYFTSIFGELGSTLTDALVDAFANGTDAGEAFVSSVSDMLETLAKQMIQSAVFSKLFQEAQKQMMGIAEKTGLTDEQRFGQYAGVIGTLTSGLKDAIPEAEALMKLFQDAAKQNGLDIFNADGTGSSQTGEQAAYTTMSQDQGRKLEGLFTSVQDHVSSIDKHVLSIVQSHASDTRLLAQIAENTSGCKYIQPILEQLQKMDRDGIKVK